MIVGIISDTHGSHSAIEQAVRALPDADCWLHVGDCSQDAQWLRQITHVPVYTARGNCDGYIADAKIDEYRELGGKRVWLTHGHHYDVKYGLRELVYWAEQYEADIVVFGHTHIPTIESSGGKYFVNPGSARYTKTCAKIVIENETVTAEILPICQK